ncbi:autotransporter outer membrane beta-barrel domain-containing protein, partial [Brucellaceae bacterium C25G]
MFSRFSKDCRRHKLYGFMLTTALCSTLLSLAEKNIAVAQSLEVIGTVSPVIPEISPGHWSVAGNVYVGDSSSNGTLIIKDGADVSFGGLSTNPYQTFEPQVSVHDSRFIISGENTVVRLQKNDGQGYLYVRSSSGDGSVIEAGALLSADYVSVNGWSRYDDEDTTETHLTIRGSNSRLISSGDLYLDEGAQVVVSDGAYVSAANTEMRGNYNSERPARIHVTGEGTQFIVAGLMQVGVDSTGILLIDEGGKVSSGKVVIGDYYKPYTTKKWDSHAIVSGEGSRWEIAEELRIGTEADNYTGSVLSEEDAQSGRLLIENGGVVKANDVTVLGYYSERASRLVIGAEEDQSATSAGYLFANSLLLKEENSGLILNHTNLSLNFDQADEDSVSSAMSISGLGTISAKFGRTIFNHDQLGFEGKIIVDGVAGLADDALNTTLQFNGDISNASVTTINAGGAIEGIGTVGTLTNSGILAPGKTLSSNHVSDAMGIGTFTVRGDYISQDSLILIDAVLGDDNSLTDKLIVTNDTSGTGIVRVNNIGGDGAQTVDGIKIIEVGGV